MKRGGMKEKKREWRDGGKEKKDKETAQAGKVGKRGKKTMQGRGKKKLLSNRLIITAWVQI